MMQKKQWRAEMRTILSRLTTSEIQGFSRAAAERLQTEGVWRSARVVLGYSAVGHELDLWPALTAAQGEGRRLALPRYEAAAQAYGAALVPADRSQLVTAGFGVLEPPPQAPVVPLNQLDLVLVPGLAFDRSGKRLGRGKGFYDRLLAQVSGIKCGVALDEQIVENLPTEAHDVGMNVILTPTRWLVVPRGGT